MYKKILIVIFLSSFLLFGASELFRLDRNSKKIPTVKNQSSVINLKISSDGRSLSHNADVGSTALSTLKKVAKVKTTSSDFGEFVNEINVIKPADNEFWAFYVNGDFSQVGAGEYVQKPGDKIKWKIIKIQQ